jgi:iron complex outermembrane recepter protein
MPDMPLSLRSAGTLLTTLCVTLPSATGHAEENFFETLPVVLSASRLPQALQDSPGAVTVIDADMIAATGYRELARLFRLVPGMQVAQERGNQQWVTYHGLGADYPNQMQVLIDGRSVYSPHYSGGANWSALPITLEDIDRIEIVRGSNSATYGANAFLGVINIITRHTGAERQSSIQTRLGDDGIADLTARVVTQSGPLGLRMSIQEQRDQGWRGLNDDQRLRVLNLRSDLQLSAIDALSFSAGFSDGNLGVGYPDTRFDGSGERILEQRDHTFHLRWRHTPDPNTEWSLSWYRNRERTTDAWTVKSSVNCLELCAVLPAFQLEGAVDNNRSSQRDNIELQHRFNPRNDLRLLWGAEWRRDTIESPFLFADGRKPAQSEWRLFGNAEWRMAPQWLWNIGAMVEDIEHDTARLAPRVFLNWQPQASSTWRIGYSRAWRQPTLYERWANVQVSVDGLGVVNQRHTPNPGIRPQRIDTWELGYLGEMPWLGGLADVRLFNERIHDYIRRTPVYDDTPFTPGNVLALFPDPFLIHKIMGGTQWANMPGEIRLTGLEYQLSMRPRTGTTLLFSHTLMQRSATTPEVRRSVAPYSATLTWMQDIGAWQSTLSLLHMGALEAGTGNVPGRRYTVPSYTTLDWSVGRSFQFASYPLAFRLTATNLLGRHQELAHKPLQAMPQYGSRPANEANRQVFMSFEAAF